jgi:hypothetical protein
MPRGQLDHPVTGEHTYGGLVLHVRGVRRHIGVAAGVRRERLALPIGLNCVGSTSRRRENLVSGQLLFLNKGQDNG